MATRAQVPEFGREPVRIFRLRAQGVARSHKKDGKGDQHNRGLRHEPRIDAALAQPYGHKGNQDKGDESGTNLLDGHRGDNTKRDGIREFPPAVTASIGALDGRCHRQKSTNDTPCVKDGTVHPHCRMAKRHDIHQQITRKREDEQAHKFPVGKSVLLIANRAARTN